MPPDSIPDKPGRLTPHVELHHVEAVINAASGSVGPNPADRLQAIASRFGLDVNIRAVTPDKIVEALHAAVEAKPDLLIVIAGDGTAGLAADLCGMDGPLVAPLPGGTMNMLPHALYGRHGWPEALEATLERGDVRTVSGGEVAGRRFYVAAILGAPALWADAREAIRKGKFWLAILRARRALLRAFSGRLRFTLDEGATRKAEALTLMCPLVSRALDDEQALEAAALDPRGAADAFRLGLNALLGKWRDDPVVDVTLCTRGRASARHRIPVILDGEPHRLDSPVDLCFHPRAFRALAPPQDKASEAAARKEDLRDAGASSRILAAAGSNSA